MGFVTDSMIIGLVALRMLPGQLQRRVTESVLIALFSLVVLAGCASQSAKTVETEKTVRYAAESDKAASAPVVTEKQTTRSEEKSKAQDSQAVC